MTRFYKHFFIYLSIFPRAFCYLVQINGEMSFDMKISDMPAPFERAKDDVGRLVRAKSKKGEIAVKSKEREENNEGLEDRKHQEKLRGVTVAPIVECLYQYPDLEQLNAMLSNMMNELTKVFIRIHKMMRRKSERRHMGTRFRVVHKTDTSFFEDIYANMTREYSQFYSNTTERVARAADDPCENQEELKRVWGELIDRSLTSLRLAAQSCIQEFLRTKKKSNDHRAKYRLEQYLSRQLAKVRSRQLHMLCDSFQLCYNDLL